VAKLSVDAGATSFIALVFIQDSTQTDGSGLAGIVYNAGGLTCYYKRNTASASVSVPINSISTLGTYAGDATHAALKEVDATHMPGVYELHLPDNALAAGAKSVAFLLKGAADMAPLPLEIELGVSVAAGQIVIKRGVALPQFDFPMFDSTGSLAPGLSVAASLCKDSASSFSASTNSAAEIGSSGWYRLALTSGELDAGKVAFLAAAAGAKPTCYTILTQA
jgi:hypothetical protein